MTRLVKVTAKDRLKIANFAKKIAGEEAHFLNGTRDAIPGSNDGFGERHVSIARKSFDPSKPQIFAAKFGKSICRGRRVTGVPAARET